MGGWEMFQKKNKKIELRGKKSMGKGRGENKV